MSADEEHNILEFKGELVISGRTNLFRATSIEKLAEEIREIISEKSDITNWHEVELSDEDLREEIEWKMTDKQNKENYAVVQRAWFKLKKR